MATAEAGVIARIESALRCVASLDVSGIPGCELPAAVLRAEQLLDAAHSLSAALLERFERHAGWAVDGELSAACWTAHRTGSARASVRTRLRHGMTMTRLPEIAAEARGTSVGRPPASGR